MPDTLFEMRPGGVALITLNRPERLNSMGGDLMPLFAEYLEQCEKDSAVRCVAVTGAGRAFCAGGDVGGMQRRNSAESAPSEDSNPAVALVASLQRTVADLRVLQRATSLRLHRMPKPTVAIVNGHAVGAGMSLALACDIRLCSSTAKFGTAFRNIALSGDFGGSYFLQRLVGNGRARELYYTAEVVDARRALEMGIANQVFEGDDWLEQALAVCARLAAGPTGTYARMKENLNLAETAPLETVLDQEALYQRMTGITRDSREAVLAFMEKREPVFAGE